MYRRGPRTSPYLLLRRDAAPVVGPTALRNNRLKTAFVKLAPNSYPLGRTRRTKHYWRNLPQASSSSTDPNESKSKLALANTLRVHFIRKDRSYKGWGLHVWGDVLQATDWNQPLAPTGQTTDGPYWDVELSEETGSVGLIVHRGDSKATEAEVDLDVEERPREVWLVDEVAGAFKTFPNLKGMPTGSLTKQSAHW